uniref:Nucleoporin NUP42 n=1 Tax=Saccoglossus kowalevskii TaxID=10224 RepID=A0ABM0M8C6_SACKO|nr:PREDICTED: uncharacterized protein LOC100376317 [Saccoglossus kowalevskii]
MNMAICRFYAQGHCRYGDRCWNEHPANASQGYGQQQWSQGSGRGYRGSSNQQWSDQRHDDGGGRRKVGFVPSMQNRYSPLDQSSSTSQHAPSVDRQQILETVKKDMEEWLQSGMWMFSSYGFSKSQKSLAGLEDTSPEELRYFTYEAREAGKWNQYSQVITQSVLEVTKRRNDLKFPDAAIKTKIIQVYIGNTNIRTVFSSPLSTHAILSGSDGIQAENTISTIVHLWVLPVKLLLFLEAKEHLKQTQPSLETNQPQVLCLEINQLQPPILCLEINQLQPQVLCLEINQLQPPILCLEINQLQPQVLCLEINQLQPQVLCLEINQLQPTIMCLEINQLQPQVLCLEINQLQPTIMCLEINQLQPQVLCLEINQLQPQVLCLKTNLLQLPVPFLEIHQHLVVVCLEALHRYPRHLVYSETLHRLLNSSLPQLQIACTQTFQTLLMQREDNSKVKPSLLAGFLSDRPLEK